MHKLIFFLFLATFSSCIQINGSFKGLTSSYGQEKNNLRIVFLDEMDKISELDKHQVYAINDKILKNYLSTKNKTLLYFWSVNCHSSVCIDLSAAQKICDDRGQELIVITEYYDKGIVNFYGKIKNPIFSIDHKYYKTNFANKYCKLFRDNLTENSSTDTTSGFRFLHFENQHFLYSERSILDNENDLLSTD